MKKLFYLLLLPTAVGLLFLNLNEGKTSTQTNSVSLQNVTVMQASAGELVCDATNQHVCTIGEAHGTGRLLAF